MQLLLTGSSGLLGSTLLQQLPPLGHHINRLLRTSSEGEAFWDPERKLVTLGSVSPPDAVIHLAGENIGNRRWSPEVKEKIRFSRVEGTRLLAETIASWEPRPKVLIAASAVGYYGNRQDFFVDEDSSAGTGFLAELAQEWERATDPAKKAGIRVIHLRLGVVLSRQGGVLPRLILPFQWGLGSILGKGDQYMSWIHLDDVVQIIDWVLKNKEIEGPVNTVSQNPITNHEFTKTLGGVLGRPTFLTTPSWLLRGVLGDMADELLLSSTRTIPQKLINSEYPFKYNQLESALQSLYGERPRQ